LGYDLPPRPKFKHQGCVYHAPFFAIEKTAQTGIFSLSQGSCNHWDCPRCGVIRAKQEYWRIVQGSEQIVSEGHELYFITVTTRGAGLKVAEAEENYLQWTNRLFTNLRGQARRRDMYWCYVQVTERQKRAHPHSHILTTYKPVDLREGLKYGYKQIDGQKVQGNWPALRSDNLQASISASGMGEQYDISLVRNVSAVARYIGKYLFKSSLHTVWPAGWRRVRYSHNWPESSPPTGGRISVLITKDDWHNLAKVAETLLTYDKEAYQIAENYMYGEPVKIRLKTV